MDIIFMVDKDVEFSAVPHLVEQFLRDISDYVFEFININNAPPDTVFFKCRSGKHPLSNAVFLCSQIIHRTALCKMDNGFEHYVTYQEHLIFHMRNINFNDAISKFTENERKNSIIMPDKELVFIIDGNRIGIKLA